MADMGEIEAQQIITTNAACQIVGYDLGPFFKEDIEHTRERGKCQEAILLHRLQRVLERRL